MAAPRQFQDVVGERNASGRLPTVRTFDFSLVRPLRFKKYRFTGGIKVFNVFNGQGERDVQSNITAPDYGTFYNPLKRSIGFALSSLKL